MGAGKRHGQAGGATDGPANRQTGQAGWAELGALAAATLLAASFLTLAFGGEQIDFEKLSPQTTHHVFARVDGSPIHCKTAADAADCVEAFEAGGADSAALWLGNSQLHSINQWEPGRPSSALLLHRQLRGEGVHLVAFSQPNANLQEHLVLYLYLAERLPLEALVLPVVFDDVRETGIRADIAQALQDPEVSRRLSGSEVGRTILANNSRLGASDLAALADTAQERSEAALTQWLEQHSALWALRPNARGTIWRKLAGFRNYVLGITPTTKRTLIPARYHANMSALRTLLDETARDRVRTYVYIVPLRSDIEPPYVLEQYASFKAEVERIARGAGVAFANFESVVPSEYWGVMHRQDLREGVQLDFMHFQPGGHVLLAQALDEWIQAERNGERDGPP